MPNALQDNADGVIEAEEARLPEPQCAPPEELTALEDFQQPALSEEELRERQDAMGTRRRPAGPPLEGGEGGPFSDAMENPSDVPETDVTPVEGETEPNVTTAEDEHESEVTSAEGDPA